MVKRTITIIIFILLLITSCVISSDVITNFRGVWYSDNVPLGPLSNDLALTFSKDFVEIEIDGMIIAEEKYYVKDEIAMLSFDITVKNKDVLFIDASIVDNNTLALRWKLNDFYYPYTSILYKVK